MSSKRAFLQVNMLGLYNVDTNWSISEAGKPLQLGLLIERKPVL